MSEENKIIELNDEDLEKVTGGEKKSKGCPWNYTLCNKTNCYDRPDGICSNLYQYSFKELRCSKYVVGGFQNEEVEGFYKQN